jgi:site-specific recombinase XerD
MLNCFLNDYLNYCKTLALSENAIKELIRYIKNLDLHLQQSHLVKLNQVQYKQLLNFAIFGDASPTTVKARIWAMKKFFCWLQLKGHIKDNPTKELNPPKIPKKETSFLSENELKIILKALAQASHVANGLRDFIIILLMAVCGLRKSSVVALDKEDFDPQSHTLTIQEKGFPTKRSTPIPSVISLLISEYIHHNAICAGALFLNRKNKRLAADGVNKILNKISKNLLAQGHSFAQTLHPHIFRHSAATQLNEVASFTVTKEMLGHRNTQNTRKYVHLSPTSYGGYMKRHPYFDYAQQNYILQKGAAL